MAAPLIGITTSITTDRVPERACVNSAYVRAVLAAGGVPVLLPPPLDARAREALWGRCQGLLLSGGGDVDPQRFAEPRHPAVTDVSRERDDLEIWLTTRALDEGRPLLAICRGLQVLNVARGGSLVQDLPSQAPGPIAHVQPEPRDRPSHDVKIEAGSRLAGVVGRSVLAVNSYHHQGAGRLGRGLRAVAWSADGLVEGLEVPDAAGFALAVQWHPEDLVGQDAAARDLFAALVAAATG